MTERVVTNNTDDIITRFESKLHGAELLGFGQRGSLSEGIPHNSMAFVGIKGKSN